MNQRTLTMREPNLDGPVVIGEPAPITDATVPPVPQNSGEGDQ